MCWDVWLLFSALLFGAPQSFECCDADLLPVPQCTDGSTQLSSHKMSNLLEQEEICVCEQKHSKKLFVFTPSFCFVTGLSVTSSHPEEWKQWQLSSQPNAFPATICLFGAVGEMTMGHNGQLLFTAVLS